MITIAEQVDVVKRDINMRQSVYKIRLQEGSISQDVVNSELAAMRAVLETLLDYERVQAELAAHDAMVIDDKDRELFRQAFEDGGCKGAFAIYLQRQTIAAKKQRETAQDNKKLEQKIRELQGRLMRHEQTQNDFEITGALPELHSNTQE